MRCCGSGAAERSPRRPARETATSASDGQGDSVARLARLWTETGEDLDALRPEEWPAAPEAPAADESVAEDPAADEPAEAAPSWMLAAVADLSGASDMPVGEER